MTELALTFMLPLMAALALVFMWELVTDAMLWVLEVIRGFLR